MFREHFSNANGVQINFAQVPSSGCPVVLLHGVTSEWQSFLPLVPELARINYVYALDLRGHGRSSRVANGYRLMDYAQDTYHFLHRQVAQPAIVYGHSLGGLIAIAVAAQSPMNVIGLILGEPPLFYYNTTLKESVWYESFAELYHILRSLRSAQEIDDHIAQHYPNMDPVSRKARANCLSHVDPDAVAMIMDHRHIEGYDTDFLLRQIAVVSLLSVARI